VSNQRTAIVLALMAASLSGCSAFRTPYQRPVSTMPSTFDGVDRETLASLDRWWENFHDSNLNAVVSEALRVNPDLALAALSVRAASLQTHLAVINPNVTAGYTYEVSKPLNGAAPTTQFHSLTASASYEIDLWGRLAAERDAARWEERATVQDRGSAALLLIGSVVNLYFEIADLNYEISVGEANIVDAQKSLHLVQILKSAGGATALDIAAGVQALESLKGAQAALIEARVERRNALSVLLAGTPWPESQERATAPDEAPLAVDAGLPATLLDRRPDLRAAELRLRETLAQTDATRLSFYPNLALTGSLGTASIGLSELVSNPLGSLAATITAPFVQWNQAHFATALARTQYDEAVLRFKKTLWQALSDVDNALSARGHLAEECAALERSLKAARTTERLTEIRYRAGAVSLSSWLEARQSRRQAELALSSNHLAQLESYATLCLSLGGGGSESVDRSAR
jgi:NodT family efflux transporter outer membrane factor (OMF) lipoprotein